MIVHNYDKDAMCTIHIVTCEECECTYDSKETTENLNLQVSKGEASCSEFTHNYVSTRPHNLQDLITSFSKEERVTVFCERFVDMYLLPTYNFIKMPEDCEQGGKCANPQDYHTSFAFNYMPSVSTAYIHAVYSPIPMNTCRFSRTCQYTSTCMLGEQTC